MFDMNVKNKDVTLLRNNNEWQYEKNIMNSRKQFSQLNAYEYWIK
jgi:hypothetical protein